jgi:hypothetical protein
MTEKLRLSATPSVADRVIGVVAGLFFVLVGTVFAALPLIADGWLRDLTGDNGASCDGLQGLPPDALPPDALPKELRDCAHLPGPSSGLGGSGLGGSGLPSSGLGPIRFVGLIGIPFALIGIYLIVRVLRTAAWLDGTTLAVRHAVTLRRANLATADISIDLITRRAPREGLGTIRQVPTLIVTEVGASTPVRLPLTLPAAELRALADAIATGRALDDRDRNAKTVADQLRAAADNPLAYGLT